LISFLIATDLHGSKTLVGTEYTSRWVEDGAERIVETQTRIFCSQTVSRQRFVLNSDTLQWSDDVL